MTLRGLWPALPKFLVSRRTQQLVHQEGGQVIRHQQLAQTNCHSSSIWRILPVQGERRALVHIHLEGKTEVLKRPRAREGLSGAPQHVGNENKTSMQLTSSPPLNFQVFKTHCLLSSRLAFAETLPLQGTPTSLCLVNSYTSGYSSDTPFSGKLSLIPRKKLLVE